MTYRELRREIDELKSIIRKFGRTVQWNRIYVKVRDDLGKLVNMNLASNDHDRIEVAEDGAVTSLEWMSSWLDETPAEILDKHIVVVMRDLKIKNVMQLSMDDSIQPVIDLIEARSNSLDD